MSLFGCNVFCTWFCVLLVWQCSSLAASEDKHKVKAKDHFKHGEHDTEYDHESFLGNEAEKFDKLTPEQTKEKLGYIFDKIDADKDGKVTEQELVDWLRLVQLRYIQEDIVNQWETHGLTPEDLGITWDQYFESVYNNNHDADEESTNLIARERRRWKVADKDEDGKLTKTEFGHFLHPEEIPHLKPIVIQETMEDMDKDKDGKISEDEYVGDMFEHDEDGKEPDWVASERKQFKEYRDKNGDKFLDESELEDWIMPSEFDTSLAEAQHLISDSDTDSDKKISKEEMLEKSDLFVGSQATDFGEYLHKHEEL